MSLFLISLVLVIPYTINTLYVNNPIPAATFQYQKANYPGL